MRRNDLAAQVLVGLGVLQRVSQSNKGTEETEGRKTKIEGKTKEGDGKERSGG